MIARYGGRKSLLLVQFGPRLLLKLLVYVSLKRAPIILLIFGSHFLKEGMVPCATGSHGTDESPILGQRRDLSEAKTAAVISNSRVFVVMNNPRWRSVRDKHVDVVTRLDTSQREVFPDRMTLPPHVIIGPDVTNAVNAKIPSHGDQGQRQHRSRNG
jgi:hypothetical protein